MSNSFTQLYIHLVWATWDRLPLLRGAIREAAKACILYECKQIGAKVICIGGTEDHIHLFVELPTTLCIADLVKQVKGSSSHKISHDIDGGSGFRWQGSYAAFTVSRSLGRTVKHYIQNQEQHHCDGTTDKNMEIAWPGAAVDISVQ